MTQQFLGSRIPSRTWGAARLWARVTADCRSAIALLLAVTLAATLAASPALASVDLRIEARPIGDPIQPDPIQAFITVIDDATGNPVAGLNAGSFSVMMDSASITIQPSDLTLPPAQDPTQRVSVIFVMDYSGSIKNTALTAMEEAVRVFIDSMRVGDYAAIIKFNNTNPLKASVVTPFTQIDDGANDAALKAVVLEDYPGNGTNLLDALDLAINEFATPPSPLPSGPKAVIVISDGGENSSSVTKSMAIADANAGSIPVFNIGVGNVNAGRLALLTDVADGTGGHYLPAPTDADITAAYATVSDLLSNEYLLTIPSSISDCAQHTLQVTVAGQTTPASGTFTRRDCDVTPNAFSFTSQTGVKPSSTVNSSPATISGIEATVPISVGSGGYSVACTGIYTSGAGTISNGQTVCVRHTSDAAFNTAHVTTLTVGGVSATFTSTTQAEAAASGGGATGLPELLLGLAALAARRRRLA